MHFWASECQHDYLVLQREMSSTCWCLYFFLKHFCHLNVSTYFVGLVRLVNAKMGAVCTIVCELPTMPWVSEAVRFAPQLLTCKVSALLGRTLLGLYLQSGCPHFQQLFTFSQNSTKPKKSAPISAFQKQNPNGKNFNASSLFHYQTSMRLSLILVANFSTTFDSGKGMTL